MGDDMEIIDGGLVKDVIKFPFSDNQVAVSGVWSGGSWNAKEELFVNQFRNGSLLGTWQVAGVDTISHRDAILILSPKGNPYPLEANDILVFGEGFYKIFPVINTDLPIDTHRAVEVGERQYHGIAIFEDVTVEKIIFFHSQRETMENQTTLPVWWRGQEFSFSIINESNYPVEFRFNGGEVLLNKLLKIFPHVRGFTLDVGQETMYKAPMKPGRRPQKILRYFEPNFSVVPGSVRFFIYPATPQEIDLLIDLKEPLWLFTHILDEARKGQPKQVINLLSERTFSIDVLLNHLKEFAEEALKDGSLTVIAPDIEGAIRIDNEVLQIIIECIENIPARELKREGRLYGIDIRRNWCRVLTDGEREDWTLRFDPKLGYQFEGKIPRPVRVVFETKTREDVRKGNGVILSMETIN